MSGKLSLSWLRHKSAITQQAQARDNNIQKWDYSRKKTDYKKATGAKSAMTKKSRKKQKSRKNEKQQEIARKSKGPVVKSS